MKTTNISAQNAHVSHSGRDNHYMLIPELINSPIKDDPDLQ